MARRRTGTVRQHGDHYVIRATWPDGKKTKPVHLEPWVTEEDAWTRAGELHRIVRQPGAERVADLTPADLDTTTVGEWIEGWFRNREDRGYTSVADDRGRWSKWLARHLEARPIKAVTKVELEAVVEDLDTRVRAGELAWKTAQNVWALCSRMFKDAATAKARALRMRDDNPARDIVGPDRGATKSKTSLWPAEALTFFRSDDIPIRWRRLVALAIYIYPREGELEALEWGDVDLDAGTIHIHRALERRSGETETTKTEMPRRIPIERSLWPLLAALRPEDGRGPVVVMPPAGDLPERLRGYLKRAGLTREELYSNDATRRAIRWHDLRATGISWMAMRGDSPLVIMKRAGHKRIETTMDYIREVEVLGVDAGEPFPALPAELIRTDVRTPTAAEWGQLGGLARHKKGVPSGRKTVTTVPGHWGNPGAS